MSGSESKQNNPLSRREIETEEMAQELMSMAMYEEGMDYGMMKDILQVINESKGMASIEPDNRASQEVPLYSEETSSAVVVAKNNSPHELITEENSLPKPSFSYRHQSGRGSPSTSGRKSSLEMVPVEEMSVSPSPEMLDTEEPKRFVGESEAIFNQLVRENETTTDKDEINENRSQILGKNPWHTLSDSSQNSHSGETSNIDNVKSKKNQRIERWRLDPTNVVVDENDVPLKENNRPVLKEKVPYSFCHNKRVFEASIGDKVLTVLTHALEEVADIWRRKHRPDVSEFQWGSPIKVGVNNRSLDKKPVIKEADSPKRCEILRNNPDSAQRRNMDRNCKRKASEYVRDVVNDEIESDEEDGNLFEIPKKSKKSKKSDESWLPMNRSVVNSPEKSLSRREKMFNNIQASNKSKPSSFMDEYDSEDLDNDDLNSLRKKNQNKDEMKKNGPPSPDVFPRRIIPPNPSKPKAPRRPRNNGEKGKRKSPVRKITQTVLEKNQNSGVTFGRGRIRNPLAKQNKNSTLELDDDEITRELEKDEPEENDMDIEIKPKPIRGLASKLHYGTSRLLETKKAEEKLEKAKEHEKLEAEKEAKMRKEETIITRYLKETEEQKEREAKELAMKEKEENWKRTEAARDRDRRRKQMQEKKRTKEADKGLLLMDDDDDDVDTIIGEIDVKQRSLEDRVQCPICLLEFSQGEIQDHAADCNQFDNLDNPGTSHSPADNDELTITNDHSVLDCNICGHFTTFNGIVYEQHVNDCLKRRQADSAATEVVEVPNSPIRCFVPISAQTESAINYAGQFTQQKEKPNKSRMKRRR